MFTVLERSALLDLDIGQLIAFGDSDLDRYTTLTHCMRWFGYSFAKSFQISLNRRPADAPFPKGSYAVCKSSVEITHDTQAAEASVLT